MSSNKRARELVDTFKRRTLPRLVLKGPDEPSPLAQAETALIEWMSLGRPNHHWIGGRDPGSAPHLRARTECPHDVFELAARLGPYGAAVKIHWAGEGDLGPMSPTVDIWFPDEAAMPPVLLCRMVRAECARGTDLHVLAETVAAPDKYTGERSFEPVRDGALRRKRAELLADLESAAEKLEAFDDEHGFVDE